MNNLINITNFNNNNILLLIMIHNNNYFINLRTITKIPMKIQ